MVLVRSNQHDATNGEGQRSHGGEGLVLRSAAVCGKDPEAFAVL
jgi:hypothetical protein